MKKKAPKRHKSYVPFYKKRRRFRKASREWDDPRYKAWREAVFERDNYKCVVCGKGGRLEAHHIASYCDNILLRLNVMNGATCCANIYRNGRVVKFGCHTKFHKLYGKGGNNLNQWIEFKTKYGIKKG